MRKLIAFNMVSLDGFFADPHGELSWHVVDEEFMVFAREQLASVDTLLFGRLTYELMASYWPTQAAIESDPDIARKMNDTLKLVASRSLKRVEWVKSRLLSEHVADEIADLKQQAGGEIMIFGSANLMSTLTAGKLIDEYRFMVAPVALAKGRGVFESRVALKLLYTRVFRSGNILLAYEAE